MARPLRITSVRPLGVQVFIAAFLAALINAAAIPGDANAASFYLECSGTSNTEVRTNPALFSNGTALMR